MQRHVRLLALCVVFALPAVLSAQDGNNLVAPGWGTIVDPDHDCQIYLGDGVLHAKVPGAAHDFAADLERWNAPRVMSEASGDFIIDVKVSGNFAPGDSSTIDGRRAYHGAGILLVKDKQNHFSLQRAAVRLADKVRHYANFELRRDGKTTDWRLDFELPADKDAFLRVERRGTRIFGSVSENGTEWRSYEPVEENFPDTIQVGVEVISSSKAPLNCAFSKLAIYRKSEVAPLKTKANVSSLMMEVTPRIFFDAFEEALLEPESP